MDDSDISEVKILPIHTYTPLLHKEKWIHQLVSRLAMNGKRQRMDLMIYVALGPIQSFNTK